MYMYIYTYIYMCIYMYIYIYMNIYRQSPQSPQWQRDPGKDRPRARNN